MILWLTLVQLWVTLWIWMEMKALCALGLTSFYTLWSVCLCSSVFHHGFHLWIIALACDHTRLCKSSPSQSLNRKKKNLGDNMDFRMHSNGWWINMEPCTNLNGDRALVNTYGNQNKPTQWALDGYIPNTLITCTRPGGQCVLMWEGPWAPW